MPDCVLCAPLNLLSLISRKKIIICHKRRVKEFLNDVLSVDFSGDDVGFVAFFCAERGERCAKKNLLGARSPQ